MKHYFWSRKFIASGFGTGLIPFMPGSFAALIGVMLHIIIILTLPPELHIIPLIILFCWFSLQNYKLTYWAVDHWDNEDPCQFVLDEIAGYLFTIIIFISFECVFKLPDYNIWYMVILNFVLFRIFDMIKLPGARWVDKNMFGPSGILLDDLISAIYAALTTYFIFYKELL